MRQRIYRECDWYLVGRIEGEGSYFVRRIGEGVTADMVRRYVKNHSEQAKNSKRSRAKRPRALAWGSSPVKINKKYFLPIAEKLEII